PERCAAVSARQAAELTLRRARTVPWNVELGLTGVARVRRYCPNRLRELVTPATEPLCGTSSIFIAGTLWHDTCSVKEDAAIALVPRQFKASTVPARCGVAGERRRRLARFMLRVGARVGGGWH